MTRKDTRKFKVERYTMTLTTAVHGVDCRTRDPSGYHACDCGLHDMIWEASAAAAYEEAAKWHEERAEKAEAEPWDKTAARRAAQHRQYAAAIRALSQQASK